MPTSCQRRHKWLIASALIGLAGGVAVFGLQIWIGFFAPHPLAAVRALAVLVMCVGIAASGTVVAVFLKLTESPALAAAIRYLTGKPEPEVSEPALKLVPVPHVSTRS